MLVDNSCEKKCRKIAVPIIALGLVLICTICKSKRGEL